MTTTFSDTVADLSEYRCLDYLNTFRAFPDLYTEEIAALNTRIQEFEQERIEAKRAAAEKNRAEFERKRAAEAEALAAWEADPLNEAAIRGWQAMKAIVPGLDGASEYMELSPALRCRYAAFTRAVLELPQLEMVILSGKQESGQTLKPGETVLERDTYHQSPYSCCEDCG